MLATEVCDKLPKLLNKLQSVYKWKYIIISSFNLFINNIIKSDKIEKYKFDNIKERKEWYT